MVALQQCPDTVGCGGTPNADEGTADEEAGGGGKERKKVGLVSYLDTFPSKQDEDGIGTC